MKKKEWKDLSRFFVAGAVISILAAVWGFIFTDIVLASTQWLLIAAVLGILGIYARMES